MRNILDDVYSHREMASVLGFKGGTACYFFYDLPRFSTDLDFNLLDLTKKDLVFTEFPKILQKYGEVKDKYIKANTIFFLLTHTKFKTAIKIEISTREIEKINSFGLIEFYGMSMLVMKKEDIFANKLIALTTRGSATARDLFDINYFFSKGWDISGDIIKEVTKIDLLEYLETLPKYIQKHFNSRNIGEGLGELLEDKTKRQFIKEKLARETLNQIKFFVDSRKKV